MSNESGGSSSSERSRSSRATATSERSRSPLSRVRAAKADRADERLLTGPKLILFGIHVSLVGVVLPDLWPLVVAGLLFSVLGLTR